MRFLPDRHLLEQEPDAQLVQGEVTMQLGNIYSAPTVAKDARGHLKAASYALRVTVRYVGAHLDPRTTVELLEAINDGVFTITVGPGRSLGQGRLLLGANGVHYLT